MKKLLFILLSIFAFLFFSINNRSNSLSEQIKFTDEQKEAVTETAELLTEVITLNTIGFTDIAEQKSNFLSYISEEDYNSVDQFLYVFAASQSSGYEQSFYSQYVYKDSKGIYHFSEKGISTVLLDVFGITEWDLTNSNFDYDAIKQEYTSELCFGAGRGGWKCEDIFNSKIDLKKGTVTVEFIAKFLFPGASGSVNETSSLLCESYFDIRMKESGEIYLFFEGIKVI